jgi:hypothetical protein
MDSKRRRRQSQLEKGRKRSRKAQNACRSPIVLVRLLGSLVRLVRLQNRLEWLRNSTDRYRMKRRLKNELILSLYGLEGSEWPRGVVVDKLIVNDPCVITTGQYCEH